MNKVSYSPLFHTLYDESDPVGQLGRGAHYSVLCAVQWVDNYNRLLPKPDLQRFAIIWDDDHDMRVIRVIEAAYMRGIFAPVLYVGEHKAFLTLVVNDEFYDHIQNDMNSYNMAFADICKTVTGDAWLFKMVKLSEASGMITDDTNKVATYLNNIKNLWNLGRNEYHQAPLHEDLFTDPQTAEC